MEHHAVVYVGQTKAREKLADIYTSANPDIHVETLSEFSIADARKLQSKVNFRPVGKGNQIFLLEIESITVEAQNALLKLFEEPPANTQFYLVIPPSLVLLPTLRSRLHAPTDDPGSSTPTSSECFKKFMSSSIKDRLELVTELSKNKDKEQIEEIVSGAEKLAHEAGDFKLMQQVMMVRQYLGLRGASTKMLLESLVLVLPTH